MMLYLVRHGQAIDDTVNPLRPLSEEGKYEISKIALFLKRAGVKVPKIFHSTEKRAQETAEIIRNLAFPQAQLLRNETLLPNDSPDQIWEVIAGQLQDVMIVGHLPFLGKLTSMLVLAKETPPLATFKTGSVIFLEKKDQPNWRIEWSISPDLLK